VLVLNQPAGDVWRLMDGELTVEQITALVARAYGRSPDELRVDIGHIVDDLLARGYLVNQETLRSR
jgi:hypothetical protein